MGRNRKLKWGVGLGFGWFDHFQISCPKEGKYFSYFSIFHIFFTKIFTWKTFFVFFWKKNNPTCDGYPQFRRFEPYRGQCCGRNHREAWLHRLHQVHTMRKRRTSLKHSCKKCNKQTINLGGAFSKGRRFRGRGAHNHLGHA